MSCSKEADANNSINNNNTINNQANKIVFIKFSSGLGQIWTANIDGSNQQKIPVNFPSDKVLSGEVKITPDGNKLVFLLRNISNNNLSIYTSNIDGSNVTNIVKESTGDSYNSLSVY